jgi:hypothetical protein
MESITFPRYLYFLRAVEGTPRGPAGAGDIVARCAHHHVWFRTRVISKDLQSDGGGKSNPSSVVRNNKANTATMATAREQLMYG